MAVKMTKEQKIEAVRNMDIDTLLHGYESYVVATYDFESAEKYANRIGISFEEVYEGYQIYKDEVICRMTAKEEN